ncbi:MAG: hypothetical protein WC712_14220 [Candidatus Brocadiia bacterium]
MGKRYYIAPNKEGFPISRRTLLLSAVLLILSGLTAVSILLLRPSENRSLFGSLPVGLHIDGFAISQDEDSAYLHGWSYQVVQVELPSLAPLRTFDYDSPVLRVLAAGRKMLVVTEDGLHEITGDVSRRIAGHLVELPMPGAGNGEIVRLYEPLIVRDGRLLWRGYVRGEGIPRREAVLSVSLTMDEAVEVPSPKDALEMEDEQLLWFPGNERVLWGYRSGESGFGGVWELDGDGWSQVKSRRERLIVSRCPRADVSNLDTDDGPDFVYIPTAGAFALCYSIHFGELWVARIDGGALSRDDSPEFCALRGTRLYYVKPKAHIAGYCDFGASPVERKLDFEPLYCDDRVAVAVEEGGCQVFFADGAAVHYDCERVELERVVGEVLFLLSSPSSDGSGRLVEAISLTSRRKIPLPEGLVVFIGAKSDAALIESEDGFHLLSTDSGATVFLAKDEAARQAAVYAFVTDKMIALAEHFGGGTWSGTIRSATYEFGAKTAVLLTAPDTSKVNIWEDLWFDLDGKRPVLLDSSGREYDLPPMYLSSDVTDMTECLLGDLRGRLFRQGGDVYLLAGLNAIRLTPRKAPASAAGK